MIKICFTFFSLKSSVIKRHIYKIFTSLFSNEMYQIIACLLKTRYTTSEHVFFRRKRIIRSKSRASPECPYNTRCCKYGPLSFMWNIWMLRISWEQDPVLLQPFVSVWWMKNILTGRVRLSICSGVAAPQVSRDIIGSPGQSDVSWAKWNNFFFSKNHNTLITSQNSRSLIFWNPHFFQSSDFTRSYNMFDLLFW